MSGNRSKPDATAQLLKLGFRPRMLDLDLAAAYCGLSAAAFLKGVAAGQFPAPLEHGKRKQWDVRALDVSLDHRSGLATPLGEDEAIMRAIDAT